MIPEALIALISGEGETLVGSMLTKGTRAFLNAHGESQRAPIWWLLTERRTWLGAAHEEQVWAMAEGVSATLERGWTWDAVHVGDHSAPLRRGTRSAALALIDKWNPTSLGDRWRLPTPTAPTPRAPAAKGATDLPEWWTANVPADPEERWLFACATPSRQPFNLPDSTIGLAPLWIGISDQQVVLAAYEPSGGLWYQILSEPVHHESRTTRDRLVVDGRELEGAMLSDPRAALCAALSATPQGSPRWARVAHFSQETSVKNTVRLAKEAMALGRAEALWPLLTDLLLAAGRGDLAAAAAAHALEVAPELDIPAQIDRALSGLKRLHKRMKKQGVDDAWIRGQLGERLASLPEIAAISGRPWPPAHPGEVWAAALTATKRTPEAISIWVDLDPSPRTLQGLAATLESVSLPNASKAWLQAATALREGGDSAEAFTALEHALGTGEERAPLHWLFADWAWQDGEPDLAREEWRQALVDDPRGETRDPAGLDGLGLQALAEVAESMQCWEAAAASWRSALAREPDHEEGWNRVVDILVHHLDQPEDAISVLRAQARHLDEDTFEEPTRPRWTIHVELARLLDLTQDPPGAAAALQEAIRGDFLTPAAFAAALASPAMAAVPDAMPWWHHLHRLHAGDTVSEGTARPPQTRFTDSELDALHLGGSGWLNRLRHSLDAPTPPTAAILTRGLEPLSVDFSTTQALVETLSGTLEVPAPTAFVFRGQGAWGVSGWPTETPVLLVGAQHLREGPRELSVEALSFLIAVELAHLRCEHPVLSFEADIIGTSKSAYGVFGKYAGTAESVVDLVTLVPGVDQIAKLQKVILLSRRVFTTRSVIDKASSLAAPVLSWMGAEDGTSGSIGREGLAGAALQLRLQADRVALLVTGDARAAVDAILRSSTHSLALADRVREQGLQAVLSDPDTQLSPDETLRITSLLEFAAERIP